MNPKAKIALLLLIDALLLSLCWILAYTFRFDFSVPSSESLNQGNNYALQLKLLLPWVLASHLALLWAMGLYKGILSYAGSREAQAIAVAGAIHFVLLGALNVFMDSRESLFELPQRWVEGGPATEVIRVPWIILVVYAMLGSGAVACVRFSKRWALERLSGGDSREAPATLIVGAGDVADSLLRDLLRSPNPGFRPVCAVAAVSARVGLRLHGIPVVGTIDKIPAVIADSKIEQVLIALDDSSATVLRQVVAACESAEVSFRIVPSLGAIEQGRVAVSSVRGIEIEDLLGRDAVRMELPAGQNYLVGETVLVTGGGGSIGSELARQAARAGAARIVLLGKGENSVFEIAAEMRATYPSLTIDAIVGDVRDSDRMERVFSRHSPTVVFHAAAHKHVPLMEDAADEAVKNNVLGTAVVASLAARHGAKRFVLISSDKAVSPVSVMGATKRLAEMIVLAMAGRSECRFVAVRFGNVLGSRGSVIPLFRKQIERGGPVTVTHPDVTRYFMTIPEAVSLVLQAGSREESGCLYLLDMGEPIRIRDLARNMITLAGLRPDVDIKIEYTGLRPGEKLHEELITEHEGARRTEIAKIYSAHPPRLPAWGEVEGHLAEFRRLVGRGSRREVLAALAAAIPDYHPSEIETNDRAPVPVATEEPAPSPGAGDSESSPAEWQTFASSFEIESPLTEEAIEKPDFIEHDLFDLALSEEAPVDADAEGISRPEEPAVTEERGIIEETVEAFLEEIVPDLGLPEHSQPLEESAPDEAFAPQEDFLVEPVAEEAEPPASLETYPEMTPQKIQIEEFVPPMSTATKPTSNSSALLVLRVSKGVNSDDFALLAQLLKTKIMREGDSLVLLADSDQMASLPAGAEVMAADGRPGGALIAEALRKHPDAGMLVTFTSEVVFNDGSLDTFASALRSDVPLAFSNFDENRDGESKPVAPHDHEGCPHERFEYGPVIAYRASAIRFVGGIREDLHFAWEYDLHLKLMESGHFVAVRESLYTNFLPSAKDGKGSAVYSPGMGPLGGFSYVFYPENMEREVTGAWEDALRRRKAWIDHASVPVNQGGRHYEVMGSIVIPILDRVKFIANAIAKVQSGTFQDFEMIIIDNGSTDGTIDLVKGIAEQDSRIRLIHGTGGTIASALNEGIRAALGKYICQLDSDDEYAPTTLGDMLGHLETHPNCGLAISYYRLMDEHARIIDDIAPITHSGYSRNQILRRDGGGAVRIFPKVVLEEFGLYDEVHYGNFGEDYDMVLKVGEKYDVDRVHKVLYHYRRHSDNTDVTRDPAMKYKNKNRSRQEALKRRITINKALGK